MVHLDVVALVPLLAIAALVLVLASLIRAFVVASCRILSLVDGRPFARHEAEIRANERPKPSFRPLAACSWPLYFSGHLLHFLQVFNHFFDGLAFSCMPRLESPFVGLNNVVHINTAIAAGTGPP